MKNFIRIQAKVGMIRIAICNIKSIEMTDAGGCLIELPMDRFMYTKEKIGSILCKIMAAQ